MLWVRCIGLVGIEVLHSWSGRAADEDEGDGEDDETQDEVGRLQVRCADDKVHGHLERPDSREDERANRDKHTLPSVQAQAGRAGRAHVGVRGVAYGAVAVRVSWRLGSELALARQVHRPVNAAAE